MATRCRQAAARAVRDLQLCDRPRMRESRSLLLRSLARAVWRQDSRLRNLLWQRHPWLRSFFSVDPSSSP
eukprot:106449-Pyramimonas_sp.AAC.1